MKWTMPQAQCKEFCFSWGGSHGNSPHINYGNSPHILKLSGKSTVKHIRDRQLQKVHVNSMFYGPTNWARYVATCQLEAWWIRQWYIYHMMLGRSDRCKETVQAKDGEIQGRLIIDIWQLQEEFKPNCSWIPCYMKWREPRYYKMKEVSIGIESMHKDITDKVKEIPIDPGRAKSKMIWNWSMLYKAIKPSYYHESNR